MSVVVEPLTFVLVAVGPVVDAKSGPEIPIPFAVIVVSVGPLVQSFSMFQVVVPLAFIASTVKLT